MFRTDRILKNIFSLKLAKYEDVELTERKPTVNILTSKLVMYTVPLLYDIHYNMLLLQRLR